MLRCQVRDDAGSREEATRAAPGPIEGEAGAVRGPVHHTRGGLHHGQGFILVLESQKMYQVWEDSEFLRSPAETQAWACLSFKHHDSPPTTSAKTQKTITWPLGIDRTTTQDKKASNWQIVVHL